MAIDGNQARSHLAIVREDMCLPDGLEGVHAARDEATHKSHPPETTDPMV